MSTMQDLIAELRRRSVFKALVTWGFVSFAILQVIEPVMHGLGLPDWVLTVVVIGLGIGFPVVALLAWAFDRDPAHQPAPATMPHGVRLALLLMGLGVVIGLPLVAFSLVSEHRQHAGKRAAPGPSAPGAGPGKATAQPAPPSIAVLPFVDLSAGHDQEYFSDGLAEEILNVLANVEGLRVVGRTSSFSFKGKNDDLRTIGQKLDVGSLLEGSVRKQGETIRVTAQLINVADGFHLWSENFDRKVADVFQVQEEIAQAVAAALKVRLLPRRSETSPLLASGPPGAEGAPFDGPSFDRDFFDGRIAASIEQANRKVLEANLKMDEARKRSDRLRAAGPGLQLLPLHGYRPADPEAYRNFLLGKHLRGRFDAVSNRQAAQAFQKAVELDPAFAAAWAALATSLVDSSDLSDSDRQSPAFQSLYKRGLEAAEKAIALDPQLADGYNARGILRALWAWDWDGGQADLDTAIALQPADAVSLRRWGFVHLMRGHSEVAIPALEKAVKLDPFSAVTWSLLCNARIAVGDLPGAEKALQKLTQIVPNTDPVRSLRVDVRIFSEHPETAEPLLAEIKDPEERLVSAVVTHARSGRLDEARKSYQELLARGLKSSVTKAACLGWLGDKDAAFAELEAALSRQDHQLGNLLANAALQPLRDDPRFEAVVKRVGLR